MGGNDLTNLTHEPSINGALFSIHDMSERHAADDELRMRGFLLDEAPAAIIAITQDGVIRRWNRQAETLLGWSRDETIGVGLSHLADHGSFHVLARTMLDRAKAASAGKVKRNCWTGTERRSISRHLRFRSTILVAVGREWLR